MQVAVITHWLSVLVGLFLSPIRKREKEREKEIKFLINEKNVTKNMSFGDGGDKPTQRKKKKEKERCPFMQFS